MKIVVLSIFIITFEMLALNYAEAFSLNLNSDPVGAEIYVRELGKDNLKRIGVSPLKIGLNEIASNYISDHHFILEMRKEGYFPYRIVIYDMVKEDINLTAKLDINEEFAKYRQIDNAVADIFLAQKMIREKNYTQGMSLLRNLDSSNLSIVAEMMGSAYYMQGDYVNALDYYSRATRLNPDNRDAFNMKQIVEKKVTK